MKSLSDLCATYRILVQGRLGMGWADRLAGMAVTVHDNERRSSVTEIIGPVVDQAALMGILGQLYSRGTTLLAVERLHAKADDEEELS